MINTMAIEKGPIENEERRHFFKTVATLTLGSALGVGGASLDMAKNEVLHPKKREGTASEITLENGKKVYLYFDMHRKSYANISSIPNTDISAIELIYDLHSLSDLLNKMIRDKSLDSLPKVLGNITPSIKNMLNTNEPVYQCDITRSQNDQEHKNYFDPDLVNKYNYEVQSDTTDMYFMFAIASILFGMQKIATRRQFLGTIFNGFALGLGGRVAIRSSVGPINNPNEVDTLDQLARKFKLLDQETTLGDLMADLTNPDKVELVKVASFARTAIMAIKIRSALKLSDTRSLCMFAGADHILLEDMLDTKDKFLIQKIIPLKEGLKKYFDLKSIYEMSRMVVADDGYVKVEKEVDESLKKLVEKYLT